jgi:molybdate transport system substrate-binding protein
MDGVGPVPEQDPDRERARLRPWWHRSTFLAALLLPCTLLTTAWVDADTLRVAVAGNFTPTLEQLAPAFETESGHELSFSSGSTGKLYAQIRQGAPFDVFLAADTARPHALEQEALVVADTRVTYAFGKLVLWAPEGLGGSDLAAALNADPPPRVALANPRVAPFGAAAEAWLRHVGAWERVASTAVRGENVSQAFHYTASGNADLGLVALGQLLAQPDLRGDFQVLPPGSYPAIEQQAVLLRDSPAGRDFLRWLTSPEIRRRLADLGYDLP